MIHERSNGIPRTVSVIADNALLSAFALGQRPVNSQVVAEVCRDLDFADSGDRSERTPRPAQPPRPPGGRSALPNRILSFESTDPEQGGRTPLSPETPRDGLLNSMYPQKRRRFSIF
jgi:hypothetical protein